MSLSRRTRFLLLTAGLGLVLLAGLLYSFRLALADRALSAYLETLGVPGRAKFTALDLHGARLEKLSVEELAVESIDVAWQLTFDQGLVPVSITVHRPSLDLDLTGETGPFPRFRKVLQERPGGEGGGALPGLPALIVEDGRARIVTAQGPIDLQFDFSSDSDGAGQWVYRGDLAARGLDLSAGMGFEGELNGAVPTRLEAELRVQGSADPGAATGNLEIRRTGEALQVRAEAVGHIFAGLPARLGLIPQDVVGGLRFRLSSESSWPNRLTTAEEANGVSPTRLAAEFEFHGEDLGRTPQVEGGNFDWAGSLSWNKEDRIVRIRPSRSLALHLGRLDRDLLPRALAEMLSPGALRALSVSLDAPVIAVSTADGRVSVDEAGLLLETALADRISVRGSAALGLRANGSADLRAETRFSLPRSLRDLSAVQGSCKFQLTRFDASVDLALEDQCSLSLVPSRSILPPTLAFLGGERLRMDISAGSGGGQLFALRLADGQVELSHEGGLTLAASRAGTINLESRIAGRLKDGVLEADIADADLQAVAVRTPDGSLDRLVGRGQGRFVASDGIQYGSGRLSFDPVTAAIGERKISLGPGEVEFSSDAGGQAALALKLATLEDLQLAVSVRDIVLSARQSPGTGIHMVLRQATVQDLWLPKRFPPMALAGEGRQSGPQLTSTLRISLPGAPAAGLDMGVAYDTGRGLGSAEFGTRGLVFSPRLQPKDLLPSLTMVSKVAGELRFNGRLRFDDQGLIDSGGQMDLSLSGFESDGMRVSGVSVPLEFSALWPVESPPGQRLTISRVADSAELTDVEVEYRLVPNPAGPPGLEIARAGMNLLGGRISVGKTRYDLGGDLETAIVEADGLDLVSVLSMITSEGLGGEGRLRGRFPVRLEDGALVVEGASLEAESPGILRFDSPEAAQTLSGAGDHVNLLLSALRNFHYDTLTLSADKAAGGEMTLGLSLAGRNPDVLEGYPFKINIGLQTDAAPLLAIFTQGADLFDAVARRVWQSGSAIR
ncbi:MAG: hypothetical protein AMJ59_07425 [Gammaproteobacteria bacterium SG8_31]|nr:MAG: hypothetical protein AMJ59_07425 [Gammaproteobacteria bacterium SG8_31]